MSNTLKTTIRLKKSEAIELKEMAFSLTKQAIKEGHQKIYTEADLVHYATEKLLKYIELNENGDLSLNISKVEVKKK